MEQIRIQTDFIKLQQALKLAGLVDQGSDVKVYLAEGMVTVNGQTVSERGKKLRHGDVAEVKGIGKVEVLAERE